MIILYFLFFISLNFLLFVYLGKKIQLPRSITYILFALVIIFGILHFTYLGDSVLSTSDFNIMIIFSFGMILGHLILKLQKNRLLNKPSNFNWDMQRRMLNVMSNYVLFGFVTLFQILFIYTSSKP